ncbi:hypothetical protein SNE510_34390 [Streptomyces sp. NE5-10]|nr:hypothetical protein SNE510_34390 [Streptomyces sp. NE5-10]
MRAIVAVGRVPHGMGVDIAQLIAPDRCLPYGDRSAQEPERPLDLESLAYRAAGCEGRLVAIEAVWDGDTVHDRFVRLPALTTDPAAGAPRPPSPGRRPSATSARTRRAPRATP